MKDLSLRDKIIALLERGEELSNEEKADRLMMIVSNRRLELRRTKADEIFDKQTLREDGRTLNW